MTITKEERRRLTGEAQKGPVTYPQYPRSGVLASLLGMLAGLGTLVLLTAALGAGATFLNLEFDLISGEADVREMSVLGIVIAALVILAASFVGGFVAGRIARHGGIRTGLGSSLWLALVFAVFTGLTLLLGAVSDTFDGFNLADRLSRFDTSELILAAALTAGGLFVLALLGGLVGGRVGETKERDIQDMQTVIDLREAEAERADEGPESLERPTLVREPETDSTDADSSEPAFANQQSSPRHSIGGKPADPTPTPDEKRSPATEEAQSQ